MIINNRFLALIVKAIEKDDSPIVKCLFRFFYSIVSIYLFYIVLNNIL
jgi:hypothetical protein